MQDFRIVTCELCGGQYQLDQYDRPANGERERAGVESLEALPVQRRAPSRRASNLTNIRSLGQDGGRVARTFALGCRWTAGLVSPVAQNSCSSAQSLTPPLLVDRPGWFHPLFGPLRVGAPRTPEGRTPCAPKGRGVGSLAAPGGRRRLGPKPLKRGFWPCLEVAATPAHGTSRPSR